MVGTGAVTLDFDEPDLAVSVPSCCEFVAVALMLGYRLVSPPAVNHEDVLEGCARLRQFKDAKARQLRRVVRFHFMNVVASPVGEPMTVREFRALWDEDGALRKSLRDDPRYGEWFWGLSRKLEESGRAVLAQEDNRMAYGKINGDPETLAAMEGFMENGV